MTSLLTLTGPVGSLSSFFDSNLWGVVLRLAYFFLFVFWIACGYWVYKDARRRIEDPWLVGTATVLGLVPPFFGAVIYMLFRPPEYLDEVRERRLEIKELETRLGKREARCPVCQVEIDPSYVVCPVCTTRLKQPCAKCKAPLEPLWQICPYCETPVAPQGQPGEDTWENAPRLRKSR
jgi:cbb3-type cytochrome oxidase subunit 3